MIILILMALATVPLSCELSGGNAFFTIDSYGCIYPDAPAVPK